MGLLGSARRERQIRGTLPLLAGFLYGHFVRRLPPPILLGALAGDQTTTAALGVRDRRPQGGDLAARPFREGRPGERAADDVGLGVIVLLRR
ncbi:hypothetical protein ACFWTC_17245 [Streptomyces sp. NPDC058619]|uniref:hypothetical protein n=1 Tax=unclassified Streptomyces TaxID=2593676 RepID=UPI00365A9901